MGRPPGYQWQPLGLDADPVPGGPQAISAEAAHLAAVAKTVTGQIATLRRIASDNTEVGQHAEKIRAAALSLAGSLQAAATRYARVSSALTGWVPELEQAQALSIRALNEAESPYAKLNQAVMLPAGPDLTVTQKQEIADYHTSVQRAQDQLDVAKALLTRATTLRDTQAAYYAAKINQASNDSLTDHESFWDHLVGDIDHWWGMPRGRSGMCARSWRSPRPSRGSSRSSSLSSSLGLTCLLTSWSVARSSRPRSRPTAGRSSP